MIRNEKNNLFYIICIISLERRIKTYLFIKTNCILTKPIWTDFTKKYLDLFGLFKAHGRSQSNELSI